MWVGLIQSVEELSRTEEGRQRDRKGKFHFCWIAPAGPSSPVQELGLMPCFQMFGLRLELMPPIPLVLRYSNCNWLFWISSLQAADGGNFSFHYHESMIWGLPCWSSGWESAVHCKGHWFSLCFGKIPYAAEQLSPCAKTTGL